MGDKDNKIAKDILRYISFFFIESYEWRMIQENDWNWIIVSKFGTNFLKAKKNIPMKKMRTRGRTMAIRKKIITKHY